MSALHVPSISRVKILLDFPPPLVWYGEDHSIPDDSNYFLLPDLPYLSVIFNSLEWSWGAEC